MNNSEKLKNLRSALKIHKLAGFIVPMNDEFQNEYVPDSAKRMEWLTGFSGSAGLAVVLANKAAVFIDGRYVLQAREQVDAKLFEQHNIRDLMPYKWIIKNAGKEAVIGYDPWLHTPSNIVRYKQLGEKAGVSFKPMENMVDAVWHNQPAPPKGKIKTHDIKFAGETAKAKIQKISRQVKQYGADLAVISAPDSICWLLNIRGEDVEHSPLVLGFLLLHSNSKIDLFVEKEKLSPPVKKYFSGWVKIHERDKLPGELAKLAKTKKKFLIDPNISPVFFYDVIDRNKGQIINVNDPCQLPKACKNKTEIAGMINAHIRDGAAIVRFLCWLDNNFGKKKIDEISAAEKLLDFRKQNKLFQEPSFPTIAGYGPNGAIVHYRASKKSNRQIKANNLLLLDSGGQYLDGTTDITRTVAIGKPTKEQKENFTRVLKGHIAIATARFPKGIAGADLDALARNNLWQAGRDYDHGTGHGVGSYLGVHEGPQRISRISQVPLMPGMIISNEPGYYKEGSYGIRIENLVLVRESKTGENNRQFLHFETITKAPLDTRLIEKKMLTEQEINWLKAYHNQVIKDLTPLLDKQSLNWLKKISVLQ